MIIQNIVRNNCTPGYEIESNSEKGITLTFYPADLSEKENGGIVPIGGLERMFENRKQAFLADFALMARCSETDSLCNSVQHYRLTDDRNIISAESTLYIGEHISEQMSLESIMLAVSSVCRSAAQILKVCKTADISLQDIICEIANPDVVHILYISSAPRNSCLGKSMAKLIMGNLIQSRVNADDMIVFDVLINRCALHPLVKRSLIQLVTNLNDRDYRIPWEECAEIAARLAAMPKSPFFLCVPQRSKSCAAHDFSEIDKGFQKADMVVLYPACNNARNIANNYCARGFVHAAYMDCSAGICCGAESESFALSTGECSFDDRLATVERMSEMDSLLLILDNFNESDKDFHRITQLPAKIILIADEDLSDYELISVRIKEE